MNKRAGHSHYFDADPQSRSAPRAVELHVPGVSLSLRTDRGVFAPGAIDPGTKLLLLEAPAAAPGTVVADVGCGYGPIAITLARREPTTTVWAIDVNERALALCRINAAEAGVADRVHAAGPGEVPDALQFDALYSNPPIRIGKLALHALLVRWLARLAPAGLGYLVVHKHLGADSLAAWLGTEGYAVQRLVSRQGYRVLSVARAPA